IFPCAAQDMGSIRRSTNAPCLARRSMPCGRAMQKTAFRAAIAAFAFTALAAPAVIAKSDDAPVTEAQLAEHIRVLAGDAFEGRAPGTDGENRTIAYIIGEWAKAGLEAVPGSVTPWLQPVPLVESAAISGDAKLRVHGRDFALEDDGIMLTGRDPSVTLKDVPAVFVGYGIDGTGKVATDVKDKL